MNPHWRTILCLAVVAFSSDALAAPRPEDRIPIDGRVVDEAGEPLSGARVEIRPVVSSYEEGIREVEGKGEPAPAAMAVSGADGRFALAAPTAGMWAVIVRADGRVPLRRVSPLLEAVTLPDAAPVRDAGFRVRVVDAQGRPLAGARVRAAAAVPQSDDPRSFWEPLPRSAVTGADGEALLVRAARESLTVWAAAKGHAAVEAPETLDAAVTVRLRGMAPRQVEIREAGGEGSGAIGAIGAIVRDARSGLVLGRLAPGATALSLADGAGSFVRIETPDGRRVTLPAGGKSIVLPAPAVRSGHIAGLFGAQRRPLGGAWIWPHAEPALAVRSDAGGAYRLEGSGLDDGLEAAAAGFLPDRIEKILSGPRELPSFGLAPASSLAGTVVDEAGHPVAGALIRLSSLDPAFSPFCAEGRAWTSAAGTFRVSGFGGDAVCRAVIRHPDFAPLAATVDGLPKALSGMRIVLHPGAAATGLLVDEHGKPATVHGAVEVELVHESDDEILDRTAVDADGRFRLSHLPAGAARLVIWRAGARPFVRPGAQIPVKGTADLGRLLLPAGETLTVRVTDPDGKPLAGAEVWITDGDRNEPALITGADGEVAFGGLPPQQDISIEICRQGSMPEDRWIDSLPAERLDVALAPAVTFSGTVLDADGVPVADALVVTHRNGTPVTSDGVYLLRNWKHCPHEYPQSTDREGRFSIGPLEPGWYAVDAEQGARVRVHLKAVEVPAEGRSDFAISLPRGTPFAITGRVTDSTGAPVAGAQVSTYALFGSDLTDADGRYRLEGMTTSRKHPTSDRVSASAGGRRDLEDAEKDVDIVPGEMVVDFVLTRKSGQPAPDGSGWELATDAANEEDPGAKAEVAGTLRGLDPGEIAWATVAATRDSGDRPAVLGLVAGDGSYRLWPLAPGAWTLHALAGERRAKRAIEVGPDDWQVAADLEFTPAPTVSGRVTTSGGAPVPYVYVTFDGHVKDRKNVLSRQDGTFAVRLDDGTYDITTETHGFGVGEPPRRLVVAGAPIDGLEIRIPAATKLAGEIRGLLPGEVPWVAIAGPDGTSYATADASGSFTATLYPGDWNVTIRMDRLSGSEVYSSNRITVHEGDAEVPLQIRVRDETPP